MLISSNYIRIEILIWAIAGLLINLLLPHNGLLFVIVTISIFFLSSIALFQSKILDRKSWNYFLALSLGVLAISLAVGPLEVYIRLFLTLCAFSVMFILVRNRLRKFNDEKNYLPVSLYLITPYLFLFTAFSIRYGSIEFLPIGIAPLFSVLLSLVSRNWKTLIFSLFVNAVVAFWVYPEFYGRVTGKKVSIYDSKYLNASLVTEKADTVKLSQFKESVLVFDFWYSKCGICFRKFPLVEKLSQKYASDPRILISVVNVPITTDTKNEAFDLVKEYQFKKFKALPGLNNDWEIEGYPQVFIFDKERKLRYYGNPNFEPGSNNIYKIIEKLLPEDQ